MAVQCPFCGEHDTLEYILQGYLHYTVKDIEYSEQKDEVEFDIDLTEFDVSSTVKKDRKWIVICNNCDSVVDKGENFNHPRREFGG